MAESDIQTQIIEYLRGRGDCYVVNFGGSASSAKGTPDLLVCFQGRFLGLEVKKPTDSYGVTVPQTIRMNQIRKAGGIGEAVTGIGDVARLLTSLESACKS